MSSATRVLNLGSINIDHVYRVPHMVRPGETLASEAYSIGAGGKGFNQSIALARAGASVCHAGAIGADGRWLLDKLAAERIDSRAVKIADGPTGHAIVQVTPDGENAIVLHAGANHTIQPTDIAEALASFQPGEHCVCQNEISNVSAVLQSARRQRLTVWFNPAPMTAEVGRHDLRAVDWLVLNKVEGVALSGESSPEGIIGALQARLPHARIVLTLGAAGAWCAEGATIHKIVAPTVAAVDTTAAGDTFVGYLVAAVSRKMDTATALVQACAAAALSVTRRGAADSIPHAAEVEEWLRLSQRSSAVGSQ